MRDAEIALNAKAEMSIRENVAATGTSIGTVRRKTEVCQNRTSSEMAHPESPSLSLVHKSDKPSLFDRLNIETNSELPEDYQPSPSEVKARTEVQTTLALNEGLSDEQHKKSLAALDKANKQG